MAWQPFWLDSSGRSMDQPLMMLDHLDAELPDDVFRQMGPPASSMFSAAPAAKLRPAKNSTAQSQAGAITSRFKFR